MKDKLLYFIKLITCGHAIGSKMPHVVWEWQQIKWKLLFISSFLNISTISGLYSVQISTALNGKDLQLLAFYIACVLKFKTIDISIVP